MDDMTDFLKGCIFFPMADTDVGFSPLVPCALEKCLRLLSSESETFTLSEKSLISLYVSNTLKYILETQVNANTVAYAPIFYSLINISL